MPKKQVLKADESFACNAPDVSIGPQDSAMRVTSAQVNVASKPLIGLRPSNDLTSATTKQYVDGKVADIMQALQQRGVSTASITSNFSGPQGVATREYVDARVAQLMGQNQAGQPRVNGTQGGQGPCGWQGCQGREGRHGRDGRDCDGGCGGGGGWGGGCSCGGRGCGRCCRRGPQGCRGPAGCDGECGRRGRRGFQGYQGPQGNGPQGGMGPQGDMGGGAAMRWSSWVPMTITTLSDGSVGEPVYVGYSAAQESNIVSLTPVIDLSGGPQLALGLALSFPRAVTLTRFCAWISVVDPVNFGVATGTVTAQLYSSPTPNNTFTALPVSVTMPLTGNVMPGTFSNVISGTLNVPIGEQERVLLIFSLSANAANLYHLISYMGASYNYI